MDTLYPRIQKVIRRIKDAERKNLDAGIHRYRGRHDVEAIDRRNTIYDERAERLMELDELLQAARTACILASFSGEVVVQSLDTLMERADEASYWDCSFDGDIEDIWEAQFHLDDLFSKLNAAMGPLEIMAETAAGLRQYKQEVSMQSAADGVVLSSDSRSAATATTPFALRNKGRKSSGECSGGDARHGPDFRSVHWYGKEYTFTAAQAAVVKLLWEAWKNGTPEVGNDYLTSEADVETKRLDHLFGAGKHPAWGTMIRPGSTKGTLRLSPPNA